MLSNLHRQDHHSPTVSPLLSSGFVPGLFSWSTVCALDDEHPMFDKRAGSNKKHLQPRGERSKERHCLPARTRTARPSLVPKSRCAPLSLRSCLCVHAWPAALLPQTMICCEPAAKQCRHYCFMSPDCLWLTVTLFILEEATVCMKCVSSPLKECPLLEKIHHPVETFRVASVQRISISYWTN